MYVEPSSELEISSAFLIISHYSYSLSYVPKWNEKNNNL